MAEKTEKASEPIKAGEAGHVQPATEGKALRSPVHKADREAGRPHPATSPRETAEPVAEVPMLVFGKWDPSEVTINDPSLMRYVSLATKKIPHTFGKKTRRRFAKANLSIVERLANKVMRTGQGKRKLSGKYIRGRGVMGKKLQTMHIVENAFEIVEKRTGKNPIQVLVVAIQNAGPREDTTRIKRGGVYYTVSVDVAPLKKVDESLKNLALAAFQGSFNNRTSAPEALAKEIIAAAAEDSTSFSVRRRDEVERIAKASR